MLAVTVGTGLAIACAGAPAAQADIPTPNIPAIANGGIALVRGATMLHTDDFGEYGCEDFVDAAYGKTTATGIPHDGALAFYRDLQARGLGHDSLPAPPGALVFSQGEDGDHVDISMGDGQYESGGVQGFAPGWGDGTDVQIIPAPNLGSWNFVGWAYAPWSAA